MIKKLISLSLCLLFTLFMVACDNNKKQSISYYDCFDTVTQISSYSINKDDFDVYVKKIHNKLLTYNQLFDIYHDYSNINNIKTINDNAGVRKVVVDNSIIDLLAKSVEYYKLTNGRVNVCLGPVLSIWHEYRNKGISTPSLKELKNASAYSNINNLVINKKNSTVYLKNKNSRLDVGAIAKGFAADKITKYAKKIGFTDGIINIGGNVCAVGNNNHSGYTVGIEDPDMTSGYVKKVNVTDTNVVTSGDYQRYYEVDGKRYCHIINSDTLFPANKNRSVTIICNDSALADALSTAVFIDDFASGIKLIDSIENCETLIIDSNNNYHYSDGFENYLE